MIHEKFIKPTIDEIRNLTWETLPPPEGGYDADHFWKSGLIAAGHNIRAKDARKVKLLKDAKDYIRLCDFPGFADYMKKEGGSPQIISDITHGDDMAALELEKLVSKLEAGMILSTGVKIGDDVSGMVPNVPAYLSGNPFNMRTRKREKTGRGPLSVFLELTTSSGFRGNKQRGRLASMIAFARAIGLQRPLNLWFCITWGGFPQLTMTAIQIETNPIDLSRLAAFCTHLESLTMWESPKAGKWLASDNDRAGNSSFGSWAYNIPTLERKYAGEILGRVISPGSEILYLPAGLFGVDNLDHFDAWMKTMIERFSPHLLDGTDRDAA